MSPISEEADYTGVRVRLTSFLGRARVPVQIDIGFGDTVTPAAAHVELEPILDFPPPRLLGYTRETSIAEKFHVLVQLGVLSSRVKDLYDIWLLSQHYTFDAGILNAAIQNTFTQRATELTDAPYAFTADYALNPEKQAQWSAYRKKGALNEAPEHFVELSQTIAAFLKPIISFSEKEDIATWRWQPGGPWQALNRSTKNQT